MAIERNIMRITCDVCGLSEETNGAAPAATWANGWRVLPTTTPPSDACPPCAAFSYARRKALTAGKQAN